MFVLSIRIVQLAVYEWFLNVHLFLAIVAIFAIWCHVYSRKAESFLVTGVGLWTLSATIHWIRFAFRNFVFGRPYARAEITYPNKLLADNSEVLKVDITIPRAWNIEAGQFVFLSIPRLGVFTGLRGHPFIISWWERDNKGLTISLLVNSRAGFTAKLGRHVNKQSLLAFIDGPYGVGRKFGDYGTVIMFASGIGIAGQLPYIKELISGYNECIVKTRRIRLVWEIEANSKYNLIL